MNTGLNHVIPRLEQGLFTFKCIWKSFFHFFLSVATGKKTFYTACLCYADEDEGMATLITNFFQSVWKDTRFFRPQFDLKMGKYVCDTTAKVIEER